MVDLYAPPGCTGTIRSRSGAEYKIDEEGIIGVDGSTDASELIAAGFSYAPHPKAAKAAAASPASPSDAAEAKSEP